MSDHTVIKLPWNSELILPHYRDIISKVQDVLEVDAYFSLDTCTYCEGIYLMLSYREPVLYDWNRLSDLGILFLINNDILHSKGLAIARDPCTGISPFVLQVEDDIWEYSYTDIKQGLDRLKYFKYLKEYYEN